MTRTLLLLRHAKSSWEDPSLPDHDRPLNPRGKRDAPRVGRALRQRGLRPDTVLSSTAKRARKTAFRAIEASGWAVPVECLDSLYRASPEALVEALRDQPDQYACILLVGHNPELQDLLQRLTGQPAELATATLAEIELPIDRWRDLSTTTPGRLENLWRPGDKDESQGP